MEQLRGVGKQSVQRSGDLQESGESLYQQSDVFPDVIRKFKIGAIEANPVGVNPTLINAGVIQSRNGHHAPMQ